jgi:hypothetical protein
MVSEAPLEPTECGLVPKGKGWFVLNAHKAPWHERPGRGFYCEFEGFEGDDPGFSQLRINVQVLGPGEPMGRYHWEAALSHGAGIEQETSDREQAYARFTRAKTTRYREGWLPD